MKRSSLKNKPELQLKRRLELVRTTIRELNSPQLLEVNGGRAEDDCSCVYPYTKLSPDV